MTDNGQPVPEIMWWRSWLDRQVHGFNTANLDPGNFSLPLTALCGHRSDQLEATSAGMPCVLCVSLIPRPV